MEYVLTFFRSAAEVVNFFGLTLLLVGFARGAIGWIGHEIRRRPWPERLKPIRELRCVVGVHILYALELMIVSDIIESFLAVMEYHAGEGGFFSSPAFYSLVQLGMLVAIRSVIDFFLSKEIERVHEDSK